ncbi:MAG TPA: mechanosensitive ion channel [Leeuwenhoekiella sp.]|nr:mechanosensitive ion channel [Leeuwenhoekiella sp.]
MQLFINPELQRFLIFSILITALVFTILYFVLKQLGKQTNNILPQNIAQRTRIPLALLLVSLLLRLDRIAKIVEELLSSAALHQISTVLLIISFIWLAIIAVKVFKARILRNYDISAENNIKARKIYTQFNILERVIIFVLVLLGIGIVLMSFDSIRAMGVTMLSTAGIAGIIIGFAAQKALGTLMAGIQIAFTQPIRIDDVVIVEGEWGRIEEITLTYVVVNIWDKRRLVVPTTYFIEQPFQNWTRNSSDLLGTVFIYTDYNVPFDKLRKELTRLLKKSPLWDQKVNVLQVTDSTANSVEIRALMSAKDSPTAFDLRVYVREKLITYIQKNYPGSFSKTRVVMSSAAQEQDHLEAFQKHRNTD